MFSKYAAMTMEERDTVMTEWKKTLRPDEPPRSSTHPALTVHRIADRLVCAT